MEKLVREKKFGVVFDFLKEEGHYFIQVIAELENEVCVELFIFVFGFEIEDKVLVKVQVKKGISKKRLT